MERLLLKPEEAAAALGLCRSKTYGLLADGTLPSIRVGRSVRVPAEALREWVERQAAKANPSADRKGAPA
jgi:excisionase family DNA binding protein